MRCNCSPDPVYVLNSPSPLLLIEHIKLFILKYPQIPTYIMSGPLSELARHLGTEYPDRPSLNAIHANLARSVHPHKHTTDKSACEHFNCSNRSYRLYSRLIDHLEIEVPALVTLPIEPVTSPEISPFHGPVPATASFCIDQKYRVEKIIFLARLIALREIYTVSKPHSISPDMKGTCGRPISPKAIFTLAYAHWVKRLLAASNLIRKKYLAHAHPKLPRRPTPKKRKVRIVASQLEAEFGPDSWSTPLRGVKRNPDPEPQQWTAIHLINHVKIYISQNPYISTLHMKPQLKKIAYQLGTWRPMDSSLRAIHANLAREVHGEIFKTDRAACDSFGCSTRLFKVYHRLLLGAEAFGQPTVDSSKNPTKGRENDLHRHTRICSGDSDPRAPLSFDALPTRAKEEHPKYVIPQHRVTHCNVKCRNIEHLHPPTSGLSIGCRNIEHLCPPSGFSPYDKGMHNDPPALTKSTPVDTKITTKNSVSLTQVLKDKRTPAHQNIYRAPRIPPHKPYISRYSQASLAARRSWERSASFHMWRNTALRCAFRTIHTYAVPTPLDTRNRYDSDPDSHAAGVHEDSTILYAPLLNLKARITNCLLGMRSVANANTLEATSTKPTLLIHDHLGAVIDQQKIISNATTKTDKENATQKFETPKGIDSIQNAFKHSGQPFESFRLTINNFTPKNTGGTDAHLRSPNRTTNANALPITVVEDEPITQPPSHDALITHQEPTGPEKPQFAILDSGCGVDIEDERGSIGFFGPTESCRVTLVTGTDEHTRPHFRSAHRHFLIDTDGGIIEDSRPVVYSTASTSFKRCLFSPSTAATRGIITIIVPPELGPSYLQFPNKRRVALINTGKAYLLPRYFTREGAEQAIRMEASTPRPHITPIPVMNVSVHECNDETSQATLWHRRLGHRSIIILQQLHEHCLDAPQIKSLKPVTRANLEVCSICPAARLKRKPQTKNDPTHPHLSAASVKAFGHCVARDHFGPLTPSFDHKYTMGQILVDLHTSDIWFYGQKEKNADESLHVIKRFEADTALHGPILRYHSDGAKEFTGSKMTEYCLNKQPPTKITFTTTAASNSNPAAENAVFRLLSIARALLIDSGLPNEHWPAACAQASEIIHVTPRLYPRLTTNEGTITSTPYFMRTGQKPSLKQMHLFGCVVHALLNPNELKKDKTNQRLEPRTIIGFFAGYSRHQRGGVRIWSPGHASYIYAHTVKLDETRTYRSLQFPKSVLSTDLPPLDRIHQPTKSQGASITLPSPFNSSQPDEQNGISLMASDPAHRNSHQDGLTPAAIARPSQPIRLAKGTRVAVFCDGTKYYPGTILGQRPGPGNSLHHCIIYDGWRRKYWHDFQEEDWYYEHRPKSDHDLSSLESSTLPPPTRPFATPDGVTAPTSEPPTVTPSEDTSSKEPTPTPSEPVGSPVVTTAASDAAEPPTIAPAPSESDLAEPPYAAPVTPENTRAEPIAQEASSQHDDLTAPSQGPSPPGKRLRKQATFFQQDLRAQASDQARRKGDHLKIGALTTSTENTDFGERFEEITYQSLPPQAGYGAPLPRSNSTTVLNLFSGPINRPDGLTAALRNLGYTVEEIDSCPRFGGGDKHDLLLDPCFTALLNKASRGVYRALFAAPPCSTFSITRFRNYEGPNPLDRGPPVIRTRSHIMGLPDVPPKNLNELRRANLLVTRCAILAEEIADHGGSFLIEHPSDRGCPQNTLTYHPDFKEHGPIWLFPDIVRLMQKFNAKQITFSACRFNSVHQKHTTILISPDLTSRLAHLSSMTCDHPRGFHVNIGGRSLTNGWNTRHTAAYTPELSRALASALPAIARPDPVDGTDAEPEADAPPTALDKTDPEWGSHPALTASIISMDRSPTISDYPHGTLLTQHEDEEPSVISSDLLPLNESEQELYDILSTAITKYKMVSDDDGSIIPKQVPRNYDEAIAVEDAQEYRKAMEDEVRRHEQIPSYELVEKPPGERVLPSIWVYDLKLDKQLRPRKYKARLCCGGHRAVAGYHYIYTHSTTASLDAFRIFVAIASYNGWLVHEDDYTTAYLNAKIDTVIYMQAPRGFTRFAPSGKPLVCRLNRAIYGCPQSGRLWQLEHTKQLETRGFTQCIAEHALFKKETTDGKKMYLLVNVDNIYSMSNNDDFRSENINALGKIFELNSLGPVEHTLGVRVNQSPKTHTTTLDQEQYIQSVFERFSLIDPEKPVKKRVTPYASGLIDLQPLRDDHPDVKIWQKPCLRLAGALNWIAQFTRPDVCFPLNMCMRCIAGAHEEVYRALLHILGYLANTANKRLTFGRDVDLPLREHIMGHTRNLRLDVFLPGDPLTFVDAGGGVRPTQCAFIYLFGGIISTRVSRLTSTVLSICEGEWFGATAGASRLMAIEPLLEFLEIPHKKPFVIFCDNKAACMLSDSDHSTRRMRHVLTRLRYLQELVDNGNVMLAHIETAANIADIGTKVHVTRVLHKLTSLMYLS